MALRHGALKGWLGFEVCFSWGGIKDNSGDFLPCAVAFLLHSLTWLRHSICVLWGFSHLGPSRKQRSWSVGWLNLPVPWSWACSFYKEAITFLVFINCPEYGGLWQLPSLRRASMNVWRQLLRCFVVCHLDKNQRLPRRGDLNRRIASIG